MRREAMPIVAAGLWLTFTGLSRFPSQPTSSASLGNLKMRDTACAARVGPLLERYIRPFGEEGKRPAAHFVNLELSQGAPTAHYQTTNPQFARMISQAAFVEPRERSRDGDTLKLAPSGSKSKLATSAAGGTGRTVVVRQPCPGEHSQP
jgi:hypothetical protein